MSDPRTPAPPGAGVPEPGGHEPGAHEAVAHEPGAHEGDGSYEPGANEPGAYRGGAYARGAVEPVAAEPGTREPSAGETVASERGGPVPSPFAGLGRGIDQGLSRGLARITGGAIGPYQTAIVRIGFSLTWLLFLLREWPHRSRLYGPDSPFSWDMAKQLLDGNHAFSVLMWNDGRGWFEVVYAVALVSSAMLLLGWRTRTASVLFMIGVLSLQNRSVFVGDGGDNVVHLMAIYLVFTRCGQVWSLDRYLAERAAARTATARPAHQAAPEAGTAAVPRPGVDPAGLILWAVLGAALLVVTLAGKLSTEWAVAFWAGLLAQAAWWAVRRYAPGEPRTVLDIIANVVHNGALLVIVVEVCLIYSTAGWYKIQGSRWEDGTAVFYPLHLDDFTPWPALSHALAGNSLMVMLITYGTVIVQVAFPFTLFNRRVKNVLLAAMMLEHASIAIVLGLPFFSLAMIAADAVFLPTGFLRWAGDRLVRLVRRGPGRRPSVLPGQRPAEPREPVAPVPPGSAVT